MAIFGVTFKDQPVSAFDHAALTALLLRDGILRGFDISASGSVVTLGAGHLVAAGRIVGNDADIAVTCSGSSGVARVTLVIDLSATASTSVFNQITIRVDTAASAAELPVLVQEDINDGVHTGYELALAVVSLSGSGVSGFVSKIGRAAPRIRAGTAVPTASTLDPGEIYLKLS